MSAYSEKFYSGKMKINQSVKLKTILQFQSNFQINNTHETLNHFKQTPFKRKIN